MRASVRILDSARAAEVARADLDAGEVRQRHTTGAVGVDNEGDVLDEAGVAGDALDDALVFGKRTGDSVDMLDE